MKARFPQLQAVHLRACAALVVFVFVSCFTLFAEAQVCGAAELRQLMRADKFTKDGKTILQIAGKVSVPVKDQNYPGSHKAVAGAISNGGYHEVWLCSGGGDVDEGYGIARELSKARAFVRIPETYFCASSCTNMTLGGYLRSIDKGGEFVIHASSAYMNLDAARVLPFFCDEAASHSPCARLAQAFRARGMRECNDWRLIGDAPGACAFGTDRDPYNRNDSRVVVNVGQLSSVAPDITLLTALAEAQSATRVPRILEMVQFYHEMLIVGRQNTIRTQGYSGFKSERVLPPVYGAGGWRNVDADIAELSSARTVEEKMVVWQEFLTQIEVHNQRVFVDYVMPRANELGVGGKSALRILDATISCRIQNACYLDQHQAAALGYHNIDDE